MDKNFAMARAKYKQDQKRRRREQVAKEQREMGEATTFFFSDPALMELWNECLAGQISDGQWENTRNSGHSYWCCVNAQVGAETKLVGTVPYSIKRAFGFSRLIPYVGDEMMEIVHKYHPNATEKDLKAMLKEISNAMKAN